MARQKKEFTADSGLGFMRLIQVYNVFVILLVLFLMLFVTGYRYQASFGMFQTVIYLVCQGITMWLIGTRKEHSREIISILLVVEFFLSILASVISGTFEWIDIPIKLIPNALLITYFMTSRRAKAVLVRPFSGSSLKEVQGSQGKAMWDPKSKDFWLRMVIYFFIFCVVGHWMEAGFCMLVKMGIMPGEVAPDNSIQFRDVLNPFYIYGIAFCMCGLLLFPIKERLLKAFNNNVILALVTSYFINVLFVAVVEYVLGLTCNLDFSVWDYRNQPFNFQGQVCLSYSLMFGVAASVVTWGLYPLLEKMFSYLKRDAFYMVFVVSLVLFLILVAMYNINIDIPELTSALVEDGVIK